MRHFVCVVLCLVLWIAAAAAQQNPMDPAAEKAIGAAVVDMENGWNTKDAELFSRAFAEDADYVVVSGLRIKGKPAIVNGHKAIFAGVHKTNRIALKLEQMRMLAPTVALGHVSGSVKEPGAPPDTPSREVMLTFVMVNGKSGWQIAAFQNTPVQRPPATPPQS